MATGNAIQSPFGASGGNSGTATVALALEDTTGTVNVSLSAAPASGEILIASSPTTATWGAAGGGGGGSLATALVDATGTVNVGNAAAPGAAGSILTSSDTTDAIWSTTTGTTGSAGVAGFAANAGTATTSGFAANAGTATTAGFAANAGTATISGFSTNAGTATTSGFATNAGTATLANALGDSGPGTVNVGGQAAPGAAGSVLTVTQVAAGGTLASWSTTAGTVGAAGFATAAGTATISNAITVSGGTVNTAAAAAPGAAGSVLISASANTATWVNSQYNIPFSAVGGTLAANATNSAVTDMGPDFSIPANYIASGMAFTCNFVGSMTVAAAGTATVGLYWNGVAGTALATALFEGTVNTQGAVGFPSFTMLWTGTSTVQVNAYSPNSFSPESIRSTIVTNVNSTTAASVLTLGITWNHIGSGTLFGANQFSFIQQVH